MHLQGNVAYLANQAESSLVFNFMDLVEVQRHEMKAIVETEERHQSRFLGSVAFPPPYYGADVHRSTLLRAVRQTSDGYFIEAMKATYDECQDARGITSSCAPSRSHTDTCQVEACS